MSRIKYGNAYRWRVYWGRYVHRSKLNLLRPKPVPHAPVSSAFASVFDFVEEVTGTWEPRPPAPTRGIRVYPTEVAPGIFVFEWPSADEEVH